VLLALGAWAGCSKETKPNAEPAPVVSSPAPAAASVQVVEARATAASHQIDEPNFELTIKPAGAIAAGQPSRAEIVLLAKEPFHVNQSYPYKFKPKQAEGLKTDKPVFSSEAVKLEEKRAVMTVGFTPQGGGKKTLAGQFSFSVCTDDKCLIEKRDLALDLDVN
jgi:hypothetical protein